METAQEDTNKAQQTKIPAEELKQLTVFIGKWNVEGKNLAGAPVGPDNTVTGDESYTWLPGDFFVMGKWNHQFPEGEHIGTSIIEYDTLSHAFTTHNFDNLGYARQYKLDQNQNTWMFTAEKERATRIFGAGGNSFTEHWEILRDEADWQPLCVLNGTKTSRVCH